MNIEQFRAVLRLKGFTPDAIRMKCATSALLLDPSELNDVAQSILECSDRDVQAYNNFASENTPRFGEKSLIKNENSID